MRHHRVITAGGVVAGLVGVAALAATGSAEPTSSAGPADRAPSGGPIAVAVGDSGGPVLYPGLVSVHFDRSSAAMANASTAADVGQQGQAISSMKAATVQMRAAWRATRYLIRTTPPAPPPVDDRSRANGNAGGGTAYAAPPDTSAQLFTLQHDLVASAAGLLSGQPALNSRLVKTLRVTAGVRDRAVAYIHRVAPPPPPAPADRAGASGAPVGTGFETTMPGVLPLLADEIATLRGTLSTHKLPAGVVSAVKARIAQDGATVKTINTFWPPLPPED